MAFSRPRSYAEFRVLQLMQDLLGADPPLAPMDSFFRRGGTSLQAAMLLARINTIFNVNVSLNTLFRDPSAEGLAVQVMNNCAPTDRRFVTAVVGKGSRLFYCVHSRSGEVFALGPLHGAGLVTTVFGIRAVGIDGEAEPMCSIPDMAAHYLAEVRQHNRGLPFALGGFCASGLVAYEMARMFHQQEPSRRLPPVLLFDTLPEETALAPTDEALLLAGRHESIERLVKSGLPPSTFSFERDDWTTITAELERLGWVPPGNTPVVVQRKMQVIGRNTVAMSRYRPVQSDVDIVLVWSTTDPEEVRELANERWAELARSVTVVQGTTSRNDLFACPLVREVVEYAPTGQTIRPNGGSQLQPSL